MACKLCSNRVWDWVYNKLLCMMEMWAIARVTIIFVIILLSIIMDVW